MAASNVDAVVHAGGHVVLMQLPVAQSATSSGQIPTSSTVAGCLDL
jgi:hypothetical protein